MHPFFEGGGIMGRGVANEGFIAAFLRSSPYDEHHFFLTDEHQVARVQKKLGLLFPDREAAGAFRVLPRHSLPDVLAGTEYEIFHLSDCVAETAPLIRLRNALSPNLFAVTGTTHSLSYARYGACFFEQIWDGVTDRDAIIATSRAGMDAVAAMFAALRKGYGLEKTPCPRLVRIPLGVAVEDFSPPEEKEGEAAALRERLGIPATHLVLLVFARISHYSKMDALPLLRALLRAEDHGLPQGGYTLVLSGWLDAGDTAAAYAEIAERLGISFRLVPSPDNDLRRWLFSGTDIFLSPVDNPQETFGLTMLEAGAASLPVVASDFDGYRDLVIHGETGFLVPTYGPAVTPETDALSGVWFDNQRHLQLAQQSIVSVPEMAWAIGLLASDKGLRARFGAAARQRVLERYTWDHVVRQHLELWDELAATPVVRPLSVHPMHPGYADVFGHYYTRVLDQGALPGIFVRWTPFGEAVYRGRDFPAVYGGVERLVNMDTLRRLLFHARRPVPLAALLPGIEPSTPAYEVEAFPVLWALKHDLLEVTPGEL